MSYAVVGILVIAFIAFVVLSAKSWHWSNIVFLCLCFLSGLAAVISTAQVLEARRGVLLDLAQSEKQLASVEAEVAAALYGQDEFAAEYGKDSLNGLSEELGIELSGQGRIWRGGIVTAEGDSRTFKFPTVRTLPDGYDNQMRDMLVFVFADQNFDGENYPVSFVGSMKVASETADALELEPVFINDQQEYDSPSSTWSLFEKAPLDRHDVFVKAFLRQNNLAGEKLDVKDDMLNEKLTQFRQFMIEQYVPADLFGFDLSDEAQAREYEMTIDRLMFDGLPVVKIDSWIQTQNDRFETRFNPSVEEVFVRYKFNENSTRPYQVDADGNIESDGQFSRNGRAVDPSLHAGGAIEFKKDDEILVDQLTADGYQRGDDVVPAFSSAEPVTEIERVFVRRLNDFPFLLKNAKRLIDEYTIEIASLDISNAQSQKAVEDTQNQSNERDIEIENLLADQEKFEGDLQIVSKFAGELGGQKGTLESKVSTTETSVKTQHREVKMIVRAMAEANRYNNPTGSGGGSGSTILETLPPAIAPQATEPILAPGEYESWTPAGDLR